MHCDFGARRRTLRAWMLRGGRSLTRQSPGTGPGRMTFAAIASSTNCHVSSADCPWRDDERGSGCGAYFADLPLRRPPDFHRLAMWWVILAHQTEDDDRGPHVS